MKDIDVIELKTKMDQKANFVLIDVREPMEHETFNIGGKLIPLGYVLHNLEELEVHKNDEIVVYCRSGMRSATAKKMLEMNGFTHVRNLEGGILKWIESFHQ